MKYKYSRTDLRNLAWFSEDMSRATLAKIELRQGEIRGLQNFKIEFKYPISVIAGTNCSGKSTLLALAACAFHNTPAGFKLPKRKHPYYTMSDFFVQSLLEIPPEGLNIWYEFLYNNWRKSSRFPKGIGRAWQSRSKRKGGKWSNYSRRVGRNVVFLGIERVVPPSERSVSKSYRHAFSESKMLGYEEEVCKIVGRILGVRYDKFWFAEHSQYRLAHAETKGLVYSGFNMGAGENTLFEIFSTIFSCPLGALLVIDEIELGLHESAQRYLMREMNELCKKRYIQVICTTHSAEILDCIPPEGRFFIERYGNETVVISDISPAYAAGRLAEENSNELDIYIEDGIAENLVQGFLSAPTRKRVNLIPIGSAIAVTRQLAARYKDKKKSECLAVLDGDQKCLLSNHHSNFTKALELSGTDEKEVALSWFKERTAFLPGDNWPECWLIDRLLNLNIDTLADTFKVTPQELRNYCEKALVAGKHHELATLSKNLSLPIDAVVYDLCRWITEQEIDVFLEITTIINQLLE